MNNELTAGQMFKKMKQFKKHASRHYELSEMDMGYSLTPARIRELGFFDIKDYDDSILGIPPVVLLRYIVEYFYTPNMPASVFIEELWRSSRNDVYIEFVNQNTNGEEGTFKVFVNGLEDVVVTKIVKGAELPKLWKISMADGRGIAKKKTLSIADYVNEVDGENTDMQSNSNKKYLRDDNEMLNYIRERQEEADKYIEEYGLSEFADYGNLITNIGSHLAFNKLLHDSYIDSTNNDIKLVVIEEDFTNHFGTYELYVNRKKMALITCILTAIDYEDESFQGHVERLD